MSELLAQALLEQHEAEVHLSSILKEEYPVGATVTWEKNGIHIGEVVANAYGDRIKVWNSHTDKEYWIYAYCIVNAMGKRG